jgi:hypothetical protein
MFFVLLFEINLVWRFGFNAKSEWRAANSLGGVCGGGELISDLP